MHGEKTNTCQSGILKHFKFTHRQ